MLLPYGHRAPEAQRTNWQTLSVPHVLNLKRPTFKDCADWCVKKKSHLPSDFMERALLLFILSSPVETCPCRSGMRDFCHSEAVTAVAVTAVGLSSSTAEARRSASLLRPLPALQGCCSQLPICRALPWPQAPGHRAGCGEHLTICRLASPPGSGLAVLLSQCSRWGALLSP